jgi:acetyl-CoA acetyltransferase
MLREAVICEPVCTPVGRQGGVFKEKNVVEMGVAALAGLLERTGIPKDVIEDVTFAQCYPTMEAPALGIGPVPSTAKALDRAGLSLKDIDLIELNEAFAAQVIACLREWKLGAEDARLNVNGSGISLGHPVGATGEHLATLLREMDRRQSRYGIETTCIGGGQGLTAVFERA